jgi:hypothetical protein
MIAEGSKKGTVEVDAIGRTVSGDCEDEMLGDEIDRRGKWFSMNPLVVARPVIVDVVNEFGFESGVHYIFECLVDVRAEMGSGVVEVTLGIDKESFCASDQTMGTFYMVPILIGARML